MPTSSHKVLSRLASASAMTTAGNTAASSGASSGPRIVNTNSRSLSLASVSSDGSTESSHVVEQEDIIALTQDVRSFKEALNKLRKTFQPDQTDSLVTLKVVGHEKLGEVLRILRHMLEKYPALQSNDLVAAAGLLIRKVKDFDYNAERPKLVDPKEFFESLDGLALAFSSRVSEYLMGDLDSNISLSSASSKTKSYDNLLASHEIEAGAGGASAPPLGMAHFMPTHVEDEVISPDKIDSLLMLHDCGVDLALQRAKIWSKYAKDVINYVEKRITMQLDLAKNLTKLVQTSRPQLQEESYLPFQSIYCTALDNDLELCASIQTSCQLLQGYKFLEPLHSRRSEHEKMRKHLKELWHKELKKMHDEVDRLRKARTVYIQRHQEWERCRDAARIAEQGAEIGATGENKLDKRKKLEDEAGNKALEAEHHYRACVDESNARHRNLLGVKSEVLQQIRELLMQADQTMKAVTVGYFQQQHTLTAPCPVQFQTLCESSRLYEPGSQYMKFVRRLPDSPSARASENNPFCFEPYTPGMENILQLPPRKWSQSVGDHRNERPGGSVGGMIQDMMGHGPSVPGVPIAAWSPSVVTGENTSETESIESRESVKSRETSPNHSPLVSIKTFPNYTSEEPEGDEPSHSKRQMSKAANSHKFQKIQTPKNCRECNKYAYFNGYECSECGLACHKKCLETLHLLCGPKTLLRKMNTFGVDLGQHLLQVNAEIPPLLQKCVAVIDDRGSTVKGIYRVSGVKSKVEKLCQAFENGAELVDLTDIHPNVIANVVKLYMRQLPEPLMTFRLYNDFIRVGRSCPAPGSGQTDPSDEWEAVTHLKQLVGQLPRYHYNTLGFLCQHLARVALHSESNNMPASNLAIVFGPTLLKTTEGSASLSSLVDTVHQTRVVELLTKHADPIFGSHDSFLSSDRKHHRKHKHRPGNSESDKHTQSVRKGSFSDDEQMNDNEPIPWETDRSPRLTRPSSPPKIIKSSLRDFSGLEGTHLPSQDSVDHGGHGVKSRHLVPGPQLSSESPDPGALGHDSPTSGSGETTSESTIVAATASSIVSISQENRVKIQVPGPAVSKTSKTSLADH